MKLADSKDFEDPFNAGQLVGMLTTLMFIEKQEGIPDEVLQKVKYSCANNLEEYFERPSEDVLLMINNVVKEMTQL